MRIQAGWNFRKGQRVWRPTGPSSRCRDVFAERLALVFQLFEAMLHHVAHRYDTDKTPVLDHRDVAETAGGHALHKRGNCLFGGAGYDLASHDASYRVRERARTMLGEGADDIALGQDSGDTLVGSAYDHGSDLLLR